MEQIFFFLIEYYTTFEELCDDDDDDDDILIFTFGVSGSGSMMKWTEIPQDKIPSEDREPDPRQLR